MKIKPNSASARRGTNPLSGARAARDNGLDIGAREATPAPPITHGSGNVFADMGLPDADELLAKSTLAIQIGRAIEARGLTQKEAGELMGLDQPKVSAIVRGRLDGYSSDRLLRFLNDLGCDVTLCVSEPNPEGRGRLICG